MDDYTHYIGCVVLPGALISATGKRKLTLEGGSVVEPLAEVVTDYICCYLLSSLFGMSLVMPLCIVLCSLMLERNLQIRHAGDDSDAVLGRGNVLRVGAVIESPQANYSTFL